MGRVRTKTVKRSARAIIENYYQRLTLDFDTNKRVCDECAVIPSKRMRNKIAGFITHLMRRIQNGPVRGISLKLQEEERERRLDFVPAESAISLERGVPVDADTKEMLKALEITIPGLTNAHHREGRRGPKGAHRGGHGPRRERPAAAAPAAAAPAAAQ